MAAPGSSPGPAPDRQGERDDVSFRAAAQFLEEMEFRDRLHLDRLAMNVLLAVCISFDAVGDSDDLDDQRVHAGDHVGGVGQGLSRHCGGSPLIDPRILPGDARESVPGDCAAVGEGSAR